MTDTKEAQEKLCQDHQEAVERYVIDSAIARTAFQNLDETYQGAKQAIIDSGALEVDQHGNIMAGWYQDSPSYQSEQIAYASGAIGIAGAIGKNATRWVDAENLSTAAAKAAIGSLYGAASTIGRAATPFIFSGLGIVTASILGTIANNYGRRANNQRKDANATMREAQMRMTDNIKHLKSLEIEAKEATIHLTKATGVLEANKTNESIHQVDRALIAAEELLPELQKPLPYPNIYLFRPNPIPAVRLTIQSRDSITMTWEDLDSGESEIAGYRIKYQQGFWGKEQLLTTVKEPTFTHKNLKPGKIYYYQIIPFNKMGPARHGRDFKAETSPV